MSQLINWWDENQFNFQPNNFEEIKKNKYYKYSGEVKNVNGKPIYHGNGKLIKYNNDVEVIYKGNFINGKLFDNNNNEIEIEL